MRYYPVSSRAEFEFSLAGLPGGGVISSIFRLTVGFYCALSPYPGCGIFSSRVRVPGRSAVLRFFLLASRRGGRGSPLSCSAQSLFIRI